MYQELLRVLPATPSEWWQLLRRVVGSWYGVQIGATAASSNHRRQLATVLGQAVGPAFDEWAAFHDDLSAAGVFHRAFRDDYALGWRPELDSVALLLLGEQNVYWCVSREHVDGDDPPVTTWLLDSSGEPSCWKPFTPWTSTTTGFVLRHFLAYLHGPVAGMSCSIASTQVADDWLADLTTNRVVIDDQVLYEGTDLIAVAGPSKWSPDGELQFAVELGDHWAGRIPKALSEHTGAGMRHGELIPSGTGR